MVKNIMMVEVDPDLSHPGAPVFTLKPVGPRPLELESFFGTLVGRAKKFLEATGLPWWVVVAAILAVTITVSIFLRMALLRV